MSPEPTPPIRNCQVCWSEFTSTNTRRRYCSKRCKSAAQRRREHQADVADTTRDPVPEPRPAATRACPHCGEPITIVALLTTPEAARPTVPTDTTIVPLHRRTC